MKSATKAGLGIAVALLVTACVLLEDRLARVAGPEIAASAVETGCTGAADFVRIATDGLDRTSTALIVRGVEAACALRADRGPVAATVYDAPLDAFCGRTGPLPAGEGDPSMRRAFNARRAAVCEGRP